MKTLKAEAQKGGRTASKTDGREMNAVTIPKLVRELPCVEHDSGSRRPDSGALAELYLGSITEQLGKKCVVACCTPYRFGGLKAQGVNMSAV